MFLDFGFRMEGNLRIVYNNEKATTRVEFKKMFFLTCSEVGELTNWKIPNIKFESR